MKKIIDRVTGTLTNKNQDPILEQIRQQVGIVEAATKEVKKDLAEVRRLLKEMKHDHDPK